MNQAFEKSCLEFKANPVTGNVTWKDATIYDKYQPNQAPDTFSCEIGALVIVICCNNLYYPNNWLLICPQIGIVRSHYLMTTNPSAENAAKLALKYVAGRLVSMYDEMQKIEI